MLRLAAQPKLQTSADCSEAEAKSRNRALSGNLGRKVSEFLRENGDWEEAGKKRTMYGRVIVYKLKEKDALPL